MTDCGKCTTCGGATRETCADFERHGHEWCRCPKTLPISVVIPHLRSREWFFEHYCRPSVQEQDVAQIIVEPGDGIGSAKARNSGAEKATQPFLFHCDDDVILRPGCIRAMYAALVNDSKAAFVYADHEVVQHSTMTRNEFVAGEFSPTRLRLMTYISTMSLMRREVYQPWDPSIRRLQDWDYWLNIVLKGACGLYINRALFEMHVIDKGITATWTLADWQRVIREKYNLPEPPP